MARSRAALATPVDESEQIIAWYRRQLELTLPPAGLKWEPVKIGPTWVYTPDGWHLPQFTLGWDVLAWCGIWLRDKRGGPWTFTMEQARFILWFFAIDERGEPLYHSGVLQRMKGWGKDPVAACLSMAYMFADVQFSHWDGDRPVGREEPDAWVQLIAVSQTQTQNTMKLFPSLVSPEARKKYGIQVGKTMIWGLNDTRQIQAVTSSVLAIEGGRPKLVIKNETQNWNSSNGGHDMDGALEGNAAKSATDAPARQLDICNAYRPGEDSVGQRTREAWEQTQGEDAEFVETGILYDSLEAPPGAPLTVEDAPAVVESIRGDAIWLSTDRIIKSITNPKNPPSESRRKWYNQIGAAEDAWTTPQEWDPLKAPEKVVEPGEEIAIFLDCSKSDDATALSACRLSDGHVFTLGMWQRPAGRRGDGWLAPREKVDATVVAAFEKYRVVGFFGDPSHVLEDETFDRYWDPLFDEWHRRYKGVLKIWARPGQKDGHAIMFDMAASDNAKIFAGAVEYTLEEIKQGTFTHDGDPRLRRHVLNARRYPVYGHVSIAKKHREAKEKIDLAITAVGARFVRRLILNQAAKKKGGRVW